MCGAHGFKWGVPIGIQTKPYRLLALGILEPLCEQVIGKHIILKLGINRVKPYLKERLPSFEIFRPDRMNSFPMILD